MSERFNYYKTESGVQLHDGDKAMTALEVNQAKRDLMMKAQGVSELAETMIFRGHLQNTLSYDEVCDFSKELLKQAGDL